MSTPDKTIQQISEVMVEWHARFERVAVLAARMGLNVDDGVVFTRHHEAAPGSRPVPTGWKFITADGTRIARSPRLARIDKPDQALDTILAMAERPAPSPITH